MNAKDKLAAARLMACEKFPYFRAAIMAMVPKQYVVIDPLSGRPTLAVTKTGVLLWSPEALDNYPTVEPLAADILHEVGHVLRRHSDRCEKMQGEPWKFNLAGDAEINDDLVAAKLQLIDPVLPKHFNKPDGLTAEEYYQAIPQSKKPQGAGKGKGQGGQGAAQDGKSGQGQGSGGQGKSNGVGQGRCGGAAGNPLPGEDEAAGSSGRSEVELERTRRTVAEAIRRESEKGRGTIPGDWARWADSQLAPPKVPWRAKLSKIVRGSVAYRPGAVDLHYTKPSRRQAGLGFGPGKPVMPALRSPQPRVAVLVDTSGSMGSGELATAVNECTGILSAVGSSIDFCAVDARVNSLQKVNRRQDIIGLLRGGGGTDMTPGFDELSKRRERPDIVVCITDGQLGNGFPTEAPPYKVIWVIVGKHRMNPGAPYGEVIEVDDESRPAAA